MDQILSFQADASLADQLNAAAAEAGVPAGELLNRALREFLYRRRSERDSEQYARLPLIEAETAAWPSEAWPEEDTNWAEIFSL